MSFLFKVVLGQGVVHPSPQKNSETPARNVLEGSKMVEAPLSPADNGLSTSTGVVATANGALNTRSSSMSSPLPRNATETSPSAKLQGSAGPASNPSPASQQRPSTSTRTLLLRIEGCTVAQDIRDALRDLLCCPDVPYALDSTSLGSLLELLNTCTDDESITEPSLRLLAQATDLEVYPDAFESHHRLIEVTASEKRRIRDGLLPPIVAAIPVLLHSMKPTATFWSRYYVVVLLQRLQEFDPYRVSQGLLSAGGIGVLLEALHDDDNDHALRNQALILLTALTLADVELQTLLAFDNAFDAVFDMIQREGGVQRGGAIVRDCLTVVLNMLRANKATQKFFREMGCAARLAELFDAVPTELVACTVSRDRRGGSSASAITPKMAVSAEKIEALLEANRASDTMLNILMAVSILSCVLRGSEGTVEELRSTQDALLRCALLPPLSRLAFSGLVIDDATRIEAVRVLAMLLNGSKRAVEEWLALPALTTLVQATLPFKVRVCSAPRVLLSYLCETTDTTLVNAGVQLFFAVLSVTACHDVSLHALFDGLAVPSKGADGKAADARNGRTAGRDEGISNSPNPGGVGATTCDVDGQCGAALARVLLSAGTTAVEKYFAAQVLRALVVLPAARQTLATLTLARVPSQLQTSTLDGLVKAQPGWLLASHLEHSFFNYFVGFILFCLNGGAAGQQVTTAALGAYVGALLEWIGSCPPAAAAFVEETSWGEVLLQHTRRDGTAHLRLWSAAIIASACTVTKAAMAVPTSSSVPPTALRAATALTQRFLQMIGGGAALDTILFDAQASTLAWQHPIASGLRTQHPSPYDEAFVTKVEQLVTNYKEFLTSVASASPPSSATMPILGLSHRPALSPDTIIEPSQQQQHSSPSRFPDGTIDADDRQRHVLPSKNGATGPTPASSATGTMAPVPVTDNTSASLASLREELRVTRAENARLANGLAEWRHRAEESEAKCTLLEQERQALAAASTVNAEMEKTALSNDPHTFSTEAVEGLRENVRLLEEALNSKEEEHQQLVETLNMMEEQLRQASVGSAAATAQLPELREQQKPQPRLPSPDFIAVMEKERDVLAQRLVSTEQEVERQRNAFLTVSNDLNDVLLLVAELDDECASARALSSVAPTPARPWTDDDVRSTRQTLATPPAASEEMALGIHAGRIRIAGERLFGDSAHADIRFHHGTEASVQTQDGTTTVSTAASPPAAGRVAAAELTGLLHDASAQVYEEATDVHVEQTNNGSPDTGLEPPPRIPNVNFSTPPTSQASQKKERSTISPSFAESSTTLPPPPPPPKPTHKSILPPPPGQRQGNSQHALHAPRYADPSFFFGGAGSEPGSGVDPSHRHSSLPEKAADFVNIESQPLMSYSIEPSAVTPHAEPRDPVAGKPIGLRERIESQLEGKGEQNSHLRSTEIRATSASEHVASEKNATILTSTMQNTTDGASAAVDGAVSNPFRDKSLSPTTAITASGKGHRSGKLDDDEEHPPARSEAGAEIGQARPSLFPHFRGENVIADFHGRTPAYQEINRSDGLVDRHEGVVPTPSFNPFNSEDGVDDDDDAFANLS